MGTTFTPGPWHLGKAGDCFQSVRDQNEHITADVNLLRNDGEGPANAALIASAPDLLAALELIYSNAGESPEWIRDRIAPAIARARGLP